MVFASRLRLWLFLAILSLFLFSQSLAQEEPLPYSGIIHIHSNISQEGSYPLRKIVTLAREKGMKILIFTDSFLHRWEYNLPVLPNIFKVSIEKPSVIQYGIKNYLQDLKNIKDEFPDMVILDGVEVTPFYWWSGNFFKKNILLHDWERHLLVIGLRSYQNYAHLPVACNRYFLPRLKDAPYLFISLSLIISGIFLLKKKIKQKSLGVILNVAGILLLLHIFPFTASRFNTYDGQKQSLPFQDLINYVNKKGGLVFWAHPQLSELECTGRFLTVCFYTESYPNSLITTSDYTGFGVNMTPGAIHDVIFAGGEWDNVLVGYCEGKRKKPAWVIAEADYRGEGKIDSAQNVFFLNKFNPQAVYEALFNGRFYISYYSENNINISLSNFHIEDSKAQGKSAFIGEEVEIKGRPKLFIKGSYIINPAQPLRIEIIRNGEIIKKFEFTPLEKTYPISENSLTGFTNEKAFDLQFQDDSLQVLQKKNYYRLNIFSGDQIILVTNPIFINYV